MLSFCLQGNIRFNLNDEGFLWYGAVHALSGEIPILDFQSYDPGRYYWSAFWMMFFGESMLALRLSVALFQLLGLFSGMIVLSRVTRSWLMLAPAGFLLILWMSARYHRNFELSTSLIALGVAYFLIQNPSLRRHFIAGVFTGLAAFLGRNLGVYSFFSFFLLILFVWARLDRSHLFRRLASWSLGIIVGYSPMLILFLVVPGFYDRMLISVIEILDRGATNAPLPVPWPWLADYAQLGIRNGLHSFSRGVLFLLMPIYYGIAFTILVCSTREQLRNRTVLLAGLSVGVLYMHYALSRPDVEHLLVAMPVLAVALAGFPKDFGGVWVERGHRMVLIAFAVLSLFLAGVESPLFWKANPRTGDLVEYDIGGSDIWIPASKAKLLDAVRRIDAEVVPKTEELLILPYWPALYVLLERSSPIHEIYIVYALSMERQREIIEELAERGVNWVFLGNVALQAGRPSVFVRTHPLLWEHFGTDFAPVKVAGLRGNFALLKRRDRISDEFGTDE